MRPVGGNRLALTWALAASALVVTWSCAPASLAATWVPVTGTTSVIAQVDHVRTADGVLHIVWARDTPGSSPTTQDIVSTTVDESATPPVAAAPTTIASAFSFAGTPAVVVLPNDNLQVFFGGIQCTDSNCPTGLFTSTSANGGATWSPPTALFDRGLGSALDLNAALLSDGTPFQSWSLSSAATVHRGLDPNTPDQDFQSAMGAGCCGYYSNLAADTAGHMEVAWYSNAENFLGVWAQAVDPATGAPSGSAAVLPGSVTDFQGTPVSLPMLSRTPVLAVPGQPGAFYVAYPVGYPNTSRVALWRVGAANADTVVDEPNAYHAAVSLAADAQGRVWIFWSSAGADGNHVLARRLGDQGLEPPVDFGVPTGQNDSIFAVDGSVLPNGDPVALARISSSSDGTTQTYYAHGPQKAPPPQNGKNVGAAPVSGIVLYKRRGSNQFVPLTAGAQIPVGSTVDVTSGVVKLTAAKAHGGIESANFSKGAFVITQRRGSSLARLKLAGGVFAACGVRGRGGPGAFAAKKHRKVRGLTGNGKGKFRTQGKYAAATVRGTIWDTTDYCDGTKVKVRRGVVSVLDLVRHRTVKVTAPHSYFARP